MKPFSSVSTPLLLLCLFILFYYLGGGLYSAHGIQPSPAFFLLYRAGLLWLVGWWLKEESRRYRVKLVYCPGLLILIAYPIVIPYYLFRTRGVKGFVTLLGLIGVFLAAQIFGAIVKAQWLLQAVSLESRTSSCEIIKRKSIAYQ